MISISKLYEFVWLKHRENIVPLSCIVKKLGYSSGIHTQNKPILDQMITSLSGIVWQNWILSEETILAINVCAWIQYIELCMYLTSNIFYFCDVEPRPTRSMRLSLAGLVVIIFRSFLESPHRWVKHSKNVLWDEIQGQLFKSVGWSFSFPPIFFWRQTLV